MTNIPAESFLLHILTIDFKILLKFGNEWMQKICENSLQDINNISLILYLGSLLLLRKDR